MKQIFICTMLLVASGFAFGQQYDPSEVLLYKDYIRKSKNQNIAGWTFLTGGIVIAGVGSAIAISHSIDSNNPSSIIPLIGLGMTLGSIPLFIGAGKNKRRAASLRLQTQPLLLPQQGGMGFSNPPSLTIRFGL